MSSTVKIQIKGLEKIENLLGDASSKIREIAHKEGEQGCKEIVEEAKRIVPIRTGLLQSSIRYWVKKPLIFLVGSLIHYAKFIEWGTSKMRSQPYLRPSIIKVTPKIGRNILRETIKYFNKKLGGI